MEFILPDYSWKEAKKIDCPYDYKLKIVHFANKTTDLIMTRIKRTVADMKTPIEGFIGTQYAAENGLTDEQREEKRQENIRRSIRRAKEQVHYAVRSCNADHMVTLSTRENIQDRAHFFEIYKRFVRLVREKDVHNVNGNKILVTRKEKRTWLYVAVPELQKRGAFHMHVASPGRQDLELLNACWYVALGGTPNDKGENTKGAVNVQFRQKRFGGQSLTYKTLALVGYMTKYIVKSFEENDNLGINRYARAHSIPQPHVNHQFIWSSFKNDAADFVACIQEVYAIADFMGLVDLQPWNQANSQDFFVLRGSL